MNTVRLVFGWLFLAGFTAAGTYYAMDEADQRVGLGRFQLHEKFGLVKMAATSAPPINNQVPPINNQTPPPVYVPPNNQIPPNTNPPPVYVPPANNQNPPNNVTPPPYIPPNNQNPPNNVTPPPYTPPNRQNPPNTNLPPVYTPPINNQNPPNTNPQPVYPPPNNNPPPATQQRQRPADFTQTSIRFSELQGDVNALVKTARDRAPAYGTFRYQAELNTLIQQTREADRALKAGDTTAAKAYMDAAESKAKYLHSKIDE